MRIQTQEREPHFRKLRREATKASRAALRRVANCGDFPNADSDAQSFNGLLGASGRQLHFRTGTDQGANDVAVSKKDGDKAAADVASSAREENLLGIRERIVIGRRLIIKGLRSKRRWATEKGRTFHLQNRAVARCFLQSKSFACIFQAL
jgi:hypothetical protein